MNVGQVEFSVTSKSLESVLASAKELQGILNGIDGKTYGTGTVPTGKTITRATKKLNSAMSKAEAERIRLSHKRNEQHIKEMLKTNKRFAKASKEAYEAPLKYQKKVQQSLVNMGAQMQTLGATLQRVTSPFTNIYRGITMGIGYRMLGTVMDSIQGAFSRYDTIKTYSKVLTNLGVDATKKFSVAGQEATDVYHNLENAVLGLPTGIDEIIESMRRYAGATGEAERATKLAIAANNAYIAGHMGDREKLFTERQLVALAGGAELSSNQWDSLRRNAPLAMKVVAKQMKMSVQEMVDALKEGTISGQEFLDVFIKAGTEGKIAQAAQVMKQTWDSVSQNIRNRLNAMGEGILNTLDTVFKKMDGRNFLQHVLGVDKNGKYIGGGLRGVIDDMSQAAQDWIKANPDEILGFFDNLQKIDWKGIVGGFAEMGVYLGRFYSGLAKTFGNANLIKWMININILGKIIQTAGGLIKGLSTPLSWIARVAVFGGGGKHSGGLANVFTNLAGAGKSAQTAAASWQGVASYATTIAAIPAFAWSFKQVVLALKEIQDLNLDWGKFGKASAQAALALTEMAGLAAGLGWLSTSGPFGWVSTLSVGVGTAEIAALSKTMKWLAEGLSAIANADLPSTSKIRKVMETVNEVDDYFTTRNPFEAIGKIFDSWTKGAEFKAIKTVGDAFSGLDRIVTTKLPKGWKDKVTKRMNSVKDILKEFEQIFIDFESTGGETYTSTTPVKGRFGKQTKNYVPKTMEMQTKMKQFADTMESTARAFDSVVRVIDAASSITSKLEEAMAKLPVNTYGEKEGGIFTQAIEGLRTITEGLYSFLKAPGADGKLLYENLSEISRAFSDIHMGNIKNQLNYIPEMINSIVSINKQLAASTRGLINTNGGVSFTGFADKLRPMFTEIGKLSDAIPTNLGGLGKLKSINKALAKVKTTVSKLKDLSNIDTGGIDLTSIQTLADKIKEALSALEEVGEKEVKIELKADITGQDQVVKDVKKEIEKVKKDIQRLDSTVTKRIYATLVSGGVSGGAGIVAAVRARIAEIRRRIAELNGSISKNVSVGIGGSGSGGSGGGSWEHIGGKIGRKVQYRAHGGSIFQPRGVDVIPSMLAEGEFVMQSMAARAIGYDVLQKLNHLDIPGAINGLYSRANVGNTINNTKNANVTVNNYNAPAVGFNKASRFVRAL